ncbi:ectonucleoside triphosphate diphosphohydrolase 6 isoform X1 [Pungitius pungitius]|uniref:ectonucleoside triphosphate diphosphohydrolase 6 isoform X1 n=1 Tax=Pungitius pungitius TaxID=134920 RepID=UPI0018898D15|nr:ectonucleoside triphosphate diphosphohydrolase 6 isoform X1 [Pungitius pungitius]
MKRAKLVGVFLLLGGLLTYLMLVKRHYGASEPDAYRPPPPPRAGPDRPVAPGRSSQYGIMFDAGSTGTRVHVFEFQMERSEAPKLAHETFRAIEPGLSAYADQPEECAAGLLELLKVAESSVPPSSWTLTPVVLKATAGLRLLDGEKAEQLLDVVRALFTDSPFLCREDSVSIMDGTDEGISAWITVNFLTGDLHSPDSSTAGMLDLGGGSTQITFSPQDEKTIQTSPIDYIRSFRMFNSTHTVYSHSYLGLGLMSARLSVLGGIDAPPLGSSTELVSPCLAPESSGSWEHADVVYRVRGQKAGEPVYEACRTKVEKVLYRKVVPVSEAADVDFYAFSYYYDRAVDLGLIGEETGGTIRVVDYMDAAKRVCSSPPVSALQSPFLCLDLVYISVLLQELGFPPNKRFKLARTINQVETSWALGATFHYIESLKRH